MSLFSQNFGFVFRPSPHSSNHVNMLMLWSHRWRTKIFSHVGQIKFAIGERVLIHVVTWQNGLWITLLISYPMIDLGSKWCIFLFSTWQIRMRVCLPSLAPGSRPGAILRLCRYCTALLKWVSNSNRAVCVCVSMITEMSNFHEESVTSEER